MITLLLAFALFVSGPLVSGPALLPLMTGPPVQVSQADTADLTALAAEYRALRKMTGHFTGGGKWNADVDAWKGRKHQVMAQLAEALGNSRYSEKQIVALLGPPDDIALPGTLLFRFASSEGKLAGAQRLLVYNWRGHHDFLYFVCTARGITTARWFLAGE